MTQPIRLLVVAEDYPKEQISAAYAFVHTRNKYYQAQGLFVTVMAFQAKEKYRFDGIEVIPEKQANPQFYDLFVFHAPNVRNHLRFIEQNDIPDDRIVLFFHGHEVLDVNRDYPKPYDYARSKSLQNKIRPVYDKLKFFAIRRFVRKNKRTQLVFVSHWMYGRFLRNIRIPSSQLTNRVKIIYNGINPAFIENRYDSTSEKPYNFVTIRGNLDDSKYAMDLVHRWALANPMLNFLVVGKGVYFQHQDLPTNIHVVAKILSQTEIPHYLDQAKCALLPTRLDSQGVLACEIASYGMPLITSDIEVCQEVFRNFPNVAVISNNSDGHDLAMVYAGVTNRVTVQVNEQYYPDQTVGQEVALYQHMMKERADE